MVKRGTYYKADGEAMPGLPMTEAAQRYYLEKGFSLTPPRPQAELVCEKCGRSDFKARIGLIGHERTCKGGKE